MKQNMKNGIEDIIKKTIEEFNLKGKKLRDFYLEQATYNLLENDEGKKELTGYKIASFFLDLKKEKIAENDLLKRISEYEFNNPKKDSEFEVGFAEMFLDDKKYFVFSKICQRISAVLDPGNAKSIHLLGRIKLREAKYAKSMERKKDFADEAMEYFNMAVKEDPNFDCAHISLGDIGIEKHDFKSALLHYEKAYQLGNRSDKLLNNLALCYGAARNKIMFGKIISEYSERFPEGNADKLLEIARKEKIWEESEKRFENKFKSARELLKEVYFPETKN